MQVTQCSSVKEAQARAGESLRALLMDAKSHSQPVLLLLSGGSAFSLLDAIHKDVLGVHVTIGVLDERFNKDEFINNFAQFTRTVFYSDAFVAGVTFIDTRVGENETQDLLVTRFEKALHDWVESHTDGVVMTTMGVGVDGHTAGIMPFPEHTTRFRQLFEDEKKWVVAYDAGDKNPYPLRVTVTMSFLRTRVNHTIVYVVGEEKKTVIEHIFSTEGSLPQTPARIFHDMKDVYVFTSSVSQEP
ncbi:MAG: hypothetical protein A3J54_01080 [Candidatus Ryanbacteria bacterium RIFCSPHIGHO2_02_FULL_45_13b]|uniref:Glucosamine/galactosamine-6-phosphate isomerase domain-containing protein n=1 Tax=Candidatus Ryanbacteria bacterium RIFCSPHIGHO2_02_FULL_45_13b TaxID=1802117 RepID=A0A1G2G8V3_9BACT|nr:MAG: hypothetical protein A3J54_01080 [Candidatus Ryanbacteria bacterium RIFCSPHIGHO2_02_FULL_45_13b]